MIVRVARSGGATLLISQGASSIGNMALAILIARESSVHEFAAFALAIPVYAVGQRFARTYIMIPRQIELNGPSRYRAGPPPMSPSLVLSGLLAAPVLVVAACVGGSIQTWLLILGLSFPGLVLYDCLRNEFLARRQFVWVLGCDLAWLFLQGVLACVAIASGQRSVFQMVCWSLPPLLIAVTMWATRWRSVSLSPRQGARHLWRERHVFSDSVTVLLQAVLSAQVLPYVVAGIASFKAVAALRAGQTLLGPINVAVLGLIPLVQMAVARRMPNRLSVLKVVHSTAVQLGVLCVCYAVVLVMIPSSVGRALFGDTWSYAAVMLLPLAFHVVGRTPFSVVTAAMRAAGLRKPLVRIRMVSSVLLLCGAAGGALLASISIAWIAWGMFSAAMISSITLYAAFRQGLARSDHIGSPMEAEGHEA